MANGITEALGVVNDLAKPGEPMKKDAYDITVQQLFANDPNALKKMNDPVVKRALMASMGDAFVKGNEKVLGEILPGFLDKINTAQFELNKTDFLKKIESEAEQAKAYFDSWKAQRQTTFDINKATATTNLDVNTVGVKAYENSVAGFAAFSRFLTAVVDCFQQGSLDPLRAFSSESSTPKKHQVLASGVDSVGAAPTNAYDLQKPSMPGAASVTDIGNAQTSVSPIGVLTGVHNDAAANPNPSAVPKLGAFGENARTATQPVRSSVTPQRKVPMINFGGPSPSPMGTQTN